MVLQARSHDPEPDWPHESHTRTSPGILPARAGSLWGRVRVFQPEPVMRPRRYPPGPSWDKCGTVAGKKPGIVDFGYCFGSRERKIYTVENRKPCRRWPRKRYNDGPNQNDPDADCRELLEIIDIHREAYTVIADHPCLPTENKEAAKIHCNLVIWK